MPYEISFYNDPGGAVTRFYETVTDADVLQSGLDRIQSAELLEKFTYLIDDYSAVKESRLSSEGVQQVATFAVEISIINNNIKFLMIMPSEKLYAQAANWKLLSYDTGWKVTIVKTKEEAEQWIKNNVPSIHDSPQIKKLLAH